MDLGNYGIGGNEVKIDASEGIAEIPQNRTLLVEQLTKDEPVAPEVIAGLTNIDEVFAHFRPEIDIEFSDAEGAPVEERIYRRTVLPENVLFPETCPPGPHHSDRQSIQTVSSPCYRLCPPSNRPLCNIPV